MAVGEKARCLSVVLAGACWRNGEYMRPIGRFAAINRRKSLKRNTFFAAPDSQKIQESESLPISVDLERRMQ